MSPTARSVNAVSAAPRWYFGRRSRRRRAPKISPSVRTITPRAGIENPAETSPTTSASGVSPSSVVAGRASSSCSRRIWRRCSTWRASDATRRILNPSPRHRPSSPASWANLPPNWGTACVSSVTSTASGSGPAKALDVPATSESSTSWRPESRSRRGGLAGEGVADRKPQRARRELRRRRELGVERRGGDDDHHRLVGGEPPADDGALGVGLPLPPPAPEPGLGLGELERRRTEEFQILG